MSEKTGVMDVVRMYLPTDASAASAAASTEGYAARPDVRATAEQYFENPNRLHGDTVPEATILHERPIHRMMIYLHASGATAEDIAKQTGYSKASVYTILKQPWARQRLVEILNESGRDRVKHFLTHEVAPSLEVLREIRDDRREKGTTRATAANLILNRALGMPTQRVETDNTNRSIPQDMQRIDAELKALREQIGDRGVDPSN